MVSFRLNLAIELSQRGPTETPPRMLFRRKLVPIEISELVMLIKPGEAHSNGVIAVRASELLIPMGPKRPFPMMPPLEKLANWFQWGRKRPLPMASFRGKSAN